MSFMPAPWFAAHHAAPARPTGASRCAPPRARPTARAPARACRRPQGRRRRSRACASRSRPTSVFVPCSTVIGRSVFSRIVRHGTASAVVSSWMPPESVSTNRALAEQAEHLEIALRRQQCNASGVQHAPTARGARCCAGARMHRPDERQPRRDVAQDVERFAQRLRPIDVGRSMQRDDAEAGRIGKDIGVATCAPQRLERRHARACDAAAASRS